MLRLFLLAVPPTTSLGQLRTRQLLGLGQEKFLGNIGGKQRSWTESWATLTVTGQPVGGSGAQAKAQEPPGLHVLPTGPAPSGRGWREAEREEAGVDDEGGGEDEGGERDDLGGQGEGEEYAPARKDPCEPLS